MARSAGTYTVGVSAVGAEGSTAAAQNAIALTVTSH